jgi:hypothetical protein
MMNVQTGVAAPGGRRTQLVVMDAPTSRDHGKHYLLTEMSAFDSEWWAMRAVMLLVKEGVDIGEAQGMAALAKAGFTALGKLNPFELKPLLDEMLSCIQIIPDPKNPQGRRAITAGGDVEEAATLLQLRLALFELHTGFSMPGLSSKGSTSGKTSQETSSNTGTSRRR